MKSAIYYLKKAMLGINNSISYYKDIEGGGAELSELLERKSELEKAIEVLSKLKSKFEPGAKDPVG